MKSTTVFKQTIKNYLEKRGSTDPLFARIITKPGKNMDDCITYILNTVKKSGENGFTDDEVYSMAIHYFTEDKINVGGDPGSVDIRINQKVDLTAEDKAEAKKIAMDKLIAKEQEAIVKKREKEEAKKKEQAEKKVKQIAESNKTLF